MKKKAGKIISVGVAAAMLTSIVSGCGNSTEANGAGTESTSEVSEENNVSESYENMEISKTVKLSLSDAQKFNDTNGDGYGEFQGWGTSLCWWANRVGYSEELTAQTAEAFFDLEKGLGMNIGRYNVGGGDNVTDENAPFYHEPHIKRSDSVVPGYCVDVTKVDLSNNSKDYYVDNFARVDFDCGYAWNYDWDADANQMNVLKAAADAAKDEFIAEAFSNSPPYFMTVSGCSSGGEDPSVDNLRQDSYTAFACYMADVIEHWMQEGVITFQSVDPMNEPATSYWGAHSEKQEGCHFSQGESQSRILTALNAELQNKGIDMIICGTDETSIEAAIMSYKSLSEEAKEVVDRIDTHAYEGTQRDMLKKIAEESGKNLWMSEVDGTYSIGKKDTGMQAALGYSEQIIKDLNGLMPTAWIMWDAVDVHVDSSNEFDTCTRQQADEIVSTGTPFWGIAIADHDAKELLLTKKYYAFGQFTKFIRPGYTLVGVDDKTNTVVAAYDPENEKVVIVAMNTNVDDVKWEFDLSDFYEAGEDIGIVATRTRGAMADGENWADVTDKVAMNFSEDKASFSAVLKGSSITTFEIDKWY